MRDTCFICSRKSYDFEHHGLVSPLWTQSEFSVILRESSQTWYLCFSLCWSVILGNVFFSSQGFNHHVKQEHNMWAYIFFFIHLDDTKPNDYTALDLYVASLVGILLTLYEMGKHSYWIRNWQILCTVYHHVKLSFYIIFDSWE